MNVGDKRIVSWPRPVVAPPASVEPKADASVELTALPLSPGAAAQTQADALALLPEVAQHEFREHARVAGLDPATATPAELVARELERAQAMDARVTSADAERALRRAAAAQELVPARQSVLFGFTALLDVKFDLSPEVVSGLSRLASERPDGADVLELVSRGPPGVGGAPDGQALAWDPPTTKQELLASILRVLIVGGGTSTSLPVKDPALAAWFQGALDELRVAQNRALGGAGAFGASLAAGLPNVDVDFFAPRPLAPEVAELFGERVSVVDTEGKRHPAKDFVDSSARARTNYGANHEAGEKLDLWGRSALTVRYGQPPVEQTLPAVICDSGRIIVKTPSSEEVGFGEASDAALAKLAKEHDLFFFAGVHHFTAEADARAEALAEGLGRQLGVMRAENPDLFIHPEYVSPRVGAREAAVLGALAGAVQSTSLNAIELPGLLERLHAAGMSAYVPPTLQLADDAEAVPLVLDGLVALKDALGLTRASAHGMLGDVVVQSGEVDADNQVLAFLKARQLGSMKAANPSGQLSGPEEVWPVLPVVEGPALAAVYDFADALGERFHLSAEEHQKIVERWWYRDEASGQTFLFVPSRGIHARDGGTQSLGDTIDLAGLLYGLRKAEVPPVDWP